RLADPPRSGDALAEPNDAGEHVDDAEPVCGRAGDKEPAIVGAEIERRVGCIPVRVEGYQRFVSVRTITTDAVGCPASPARSPSRRPVPVTVALPGLLVHEHLSARPDSARPLTSLKCIR